MFNWATFRQTKGAVKFHLLLDHDGYLPVFAHLTDGNVGDLKVAQTLIFQRAVSWCWIGLMWTTSSSPAGRERASSLSPASKPMRNCVESRDWPVPQNGPSAKR